MTTKRFPRAKYLRQLMAMQMDLQEWTISYKHAVEDHTDDWLGSRFSDRILVLQEAVEQISQLRDTMYGLPRVS